MIFLQIPVGSQRNFSYLIGDEDGKEAAVVDPGWEVDKIIGEIDKRGLRIKYIINTHHHRDHSGGNEELKDKRGGLIVAHSASPLPRDLVVEEGQVLKLGKLAIKVLHTPGHTPDSISLMVEDKLLTGDTLFVGDCGRTDLPGGSSADMYQSLFHKLLLLDDRVEVYPGHDYGDRPSSTIGHERNHNYTLKPRSKEGFIKFMMEP